MSNSPELTAVGVIEVITETLRCLTLKSTQRKQPRPEEEA